ncbi:MAG: hypothetical protein Q8K92_12055 [Leadbetterella sp.]|nr:hypothetical protein [Leadbetterella sp.]
MKNKTSLLLILTIVFAVALVSSVSTQKTAVAKSDKAVENQNANANSQVNTADTETTDATATDAQNKGKKDKTKDNKGQVTAESHRSTVATFVQSLLAVADREGGIGQQVKVVAQQQNDSKEKVAESIDKVEKRSKVKTFFFGSDFKNLGDLRSQMVQTRNQIAQLTRLADKAENDQNKTELQSQIETLNQEQANIETFITQNENKFSLFGWTVKLFSK